MVNITSLMDFRAEASADLTLGKYLGPEMSETVAGAGEEKARAGIITKARAKIKRAIII